MTEGAWSLGANLMGTTVRVVHDAPYEDPPVEHDQRFWITEVRLSGSYGLSDRLAIEAQLPFRMNAMSVKFKRLDGQPLEPGFESIHHRNETLRGIGDPRIGGRFGAGPISMLVGLSIPLGNTVENPFALGDAGLPHQHVQFGSGSFYPYFEAYGGHTFGRIETLVHAHGSFPVFENEHGFLPGRRYGASLEAGTRLATKNRIAVRLDMLREEPERWDGRVQQDGNLGRTDTLVSLGARRMLREDTSLSLDVAIPVWTHVRGGQLEFPAIVSVGVSRSFGQQAPP